MNKLDLEIMPDRWTRWSFDRLRLLQPHIQTHGLFQMEQRFYIQVSNLSEAKARDGKSLSEWFKDNKAMTSPVELSSEVPNGSVKIKDRTPLELASLAGTPRTIADIINELNLLLGIDFPRFRAKDFPPYDGYVEVERQLNDIETIKLNDALKSLQIEINWKIIVKPDFEESTSAEPKLRPEGNIELLTARFPALGRSSKNLQRLMESDEQYWVDSGRRILAGDAPKDSFVPSSWSKEKNTSILNASTFTTDNIRNHICLFEETNLIFPISQNYQDALGSLGIAENDLVSLAESGKLKIVLPLTVERYPIRVLDQLSEAAPGQILFPRRLTAGLIQNSRKKFPFLFPSCSLEARQQYLRASLEIGDLLADTPLKSIFDIYSEFMIDNWPSFEEIYNRRGPLGLQTHGMGALISHFAKKIANQNIFLELGYADLGIGIASALGSTYFPHEGSASWSDEGVSSLMASVYTGGPGQILSGYQRRLNVVLDGVLSIRKDVPVTELAEAMKSSDINRLRKMAFQMASDKKVSVESISENLKSFNKQIECIESKRERLAKWDIGSVILSVPGTLVGIEQPVIGFVLGLLGQRISKEIPGLRARHPIAGSVIDSLESMILTSHPDKIFLARLRKQIET